MTTQQKPLTVYKASAGSGKTFTLATEYIKLLIADPQNYRYILAVTFTNKATAEMKSRILSQLYGIAHALPDSEPYMSMIRPQFASLGLDDREIRRRASLALEQMVHNYNYFRVETIDSFFQSVLRNLARELGLTANLNVGLNDAQVESDAVDSLVEDIQPGDKLLTWIMDFVQQKIQDDKNWNVIAQIKDFGLNIFKDYFKDHQDDLRRIMNDPEFFRQYTARLIALKQAADKQMQGYAEKYDRLAQNCALSDDNYSHGYQNVPGYFERLAQGKYIDDKFPNSYVRNGIDDPEKLLKKADIGTAAGQAIINQVAPLLREAEASRQRQAIIVNSVNVTLRHINELRLLGRIEETVRAINQANNNYLLSGTQKLLQRLIDHQDTPFIYEKIGGSLKYIMIDEFQDTSTVQWENFKVLLDDCIAHQAGSLIVGDVKQSIYRWRSGDWHLLQSLTESETIHVKPLEMNWRSMRNIIGFNNAFFSTAAMLLNVSEIARLKAQHAPEDVIREANGIQEAYEDVTQKVPEKRKNEGFVEIKLLPKRDFEQKTIQQVQEIIEKLLEKGTPQQKIAILVRSNKNIQTLAEYFQQNAINVNGQPMKVNMVSDEAFRLDASLAVTTIITAMHVLTHPDDRLAKAALLKAYCKVNGQEAIDTSIYIANDDIDQQLPEAFTAHRERLLSTPIIDLAEELYEILGLRRLTGQSAYMCAFFDKLQAYMKDHVAGIDDFLDEWAETLGATSLHSDEVDGIRLLTIHKSKGLEFDHVIIPWCEWAIEKPEEVLWVSPQEPPFNELPVVPVNLTAKVLRQSIYANDYEREHLKNIVDNLNVLYVAFTRAGRNLFIIGKDPTNYKKKGDSTATKSLTPSQLIADVLDHIVLVGPISDSASEADGRQFSFGTLSLSEPKKVKQTDNVFLQEVVGQKVNIRNYPPQAFFRQSNDSADFIMPDDEAEEQERHRGYIETGNILHALFASIRTLDDVDRAIDQMEFNGVLYDKPLTRQELKSMISSRMQNPQIANWFSSEWSVLNECSILVGVNPNGSIQELRPDRVIYDSRQTIVIDFKTGRQRQEHEAQVRGYMQQLVAMGYPQVSGYLWYIRPNIVVPVRP